MLTTFAVVVEILIFQMDHITKPIKFKDLDLYNKSRMLHEHSQNILI